MRDDAGGKDESCFLCCAIDRSQQATSGDPGPPRLGINRDLAHSRQVNHQAAIARTKTCEAMPSTADSSKNSGLRGGLDRALHVAHICAARDEAWCLSYHAIPDDARVLVARFGRGAASHL